MNEVKKPKGIKKKVRGSLRSKAGLPAKAGRRKPPANKGKHVTSPESRAYARWLHDIGTTSWLEATGRDKFKE